VQQLRQAVPKHQRRERHAEQRERGITERLGPRR
jgi:hypothetical protein